MYLIKYILPSGANVTLAHDEKYDGPIQNYIDSDYYNVEKINKMPLKDHVYLQDLDDRNDELAELREKLRRERFTEEERLEEMKRDGLIKEKEDD